MADLYEGLTEAVPTKPAGNLYEGLTEVVPRGTSPREAVGLLEHVQAGFQQSVAGLAWRRKLPDLVMNPETSKWFERLATGVTAVAADLPIMIPAGGAGATVGAAAGPVGGILAGGAAMFAAPAFLRESLIQAYKAGEAQTPVDWANAVQEVAKTTAKEALIGAAAMGAGAVARGGAAAAMGGGAEVAKAVGLGTATMATRGAARVAGATDVAGQIAGMVTLPAAIQGHLPEAREFVDAAAVILTLKAGHMAVDAALQRRTSDRIAEVYVKTGKTPIEQVADAQRNPEVADALTRPESELRTTEPARSPTIQESLFRDTARIAEIERKAEGTPDREVPGEDGKPVTVRGEPKQFLTDAEKTELDALRTRVADLEERLKTAPPFERMTEEDLRASEARVKADFERQILEANQARRDAGLQPYGDADYAATLAEAQAKLIVKFAEKNGMDPEQYYRERYLLNRDETQAEAAAAEAAIPPEAPRFEVPEVDMFGNPVEAPMVPRRAVDGLKTQEVPIQDLRLSKEVPQFKMAANEEGVIVPLGGKFDRTGVGPIQVWERMDGSMEIISGRHRFDLAKRSGEETIPAQIHREAEGFTAARAAALDAELNIREEQGSVADYVQHFQASGLTQEAAHELGLLARAKGRAGFAIARDGTDDLRAAHRADRLSDEAALAISAAAPGSDRLQALGMAMVQEGKSILVAVNTMKAVDLMAAERMAKGAQGDIFGFDDSAMREASIMAKRASSMQRKISEQISAVSGASKRPELARKMGVDVQDPEGIQKRIGELRQEQTLWDNWPLHPELVAKLRAQLEPAGVTGREGELKQGAQEKPLPENLPEFVRRVVDSKTIDEYDQMHRGPTAGVEEGELIAYHLTDNPSILRAALASGKRLTEGREADKYGDLGRGLYVSGIPHFWGGRSAGKWDFLKRLTPEERNKIADKLAADPNVTGEQKGYYTESERGRAQKAIEEFRNGNDAAAGTLANQPLNLNISRSAFLEELGIKAGTMPKSVEVRLRGRFAELNRHIDDAEGRQLEEMGFDGAFVKMSMGTSAQTVVWNPDAVRIAGEKTLLFQGPKGEGAKPEEQAPVTPPEFELKPETPAEARARDLEAAAAAMRKLEAERRADAAKGKKVKVDQADLFNTQNTLFQSGPGERWYSALTRALEASPTKQAPAQGWKDWLKGLPSKGVKADEIKWSGIEEWLDLQQGKVTKAQVEEFLAGNGVKVKERQLGGPGEKTIRDPEIASDVATIERSGWKIEVNDEDRTMIAFIDPTHGDFLRAADMRQDMVGSTDPATPYPPIPESVVRAAERIEQYWEDPHITEEHAPATKFSQYTLPGAKEGSYRELLLTLPPATEDAQAARILSAAGLTLIKEGNNRYTADAHGQRVTPTDIDADIPRDPNARDATPAEQKAIEAARGAKGTTPFTSSHFDEPNILAHVRFNERTDAEGKRVLFVEEIQSDWAQQGKKRGFSGEEEPPPTELPPGSHPVRLRSAEENATDGRGASVPRSMDEAHQMRDEYIRLGVAPEDIVIREAALPDNHTPGERYTAQRGPEGFMVTDARGRVRSDRTDMRASEAEQLAYQWNADSLDPIKVYVAEYGVRGPDGNLLSAAGGSMVQNYSAAGAMEAALNTLIRNHEARQKKDRVQPAPFVGKTEAWVGLVLKRMIRYAAENGFDRVAWTTGEQQAARYDLSKHIREVEYGPGAGGDGYVRFSVITHNGDKRSMTNAEGVAPEKLPEMIGKDVADKMIRGVQGVTYPAYASSIKGLDLKVGGEGMKAFYDKIVPNVANDVLKKLGGGRTTEIGVKLHGVGSTEEIRVLEFSDGTAAVERGGNTTTFNSVAEAEAHRKALIGEIAQPGFDITPAMREKAMQGMPLFQSNRAKFDVADRIITTFRNADKTSVIHELGHFWLEEYKWAASRPEATAEIKADWDILRKELAIGAEGEIPRASHELFADQWERYHAEGVAPTPRLQAIFEKFKSWMLEVYQAVVNMRQPILNPELKAFFDRMYASEQEIADARNLGVPREYVDAARATTAERIVPTHERKLPEPGFVDEILANDPLAAEVLKGPGSGATKDSRVNAQYINGPTDLKLAIQQVANIDQANIQARRGGTEGVKSWEQANAEADKVVEDIMGGKMALGGLAEGIPHDIKQRAAFKVMVAIANYSLNLRSEILKIGDNATIQQQFDYLNSVLRVRMAHAEFLGLRAAAARAQNQIRDMTPESGVVARMVELTGGKIETLFQEGRTPAEEAAALKIKLQEIMAQHFSGRSALDIAKLHADIKDLKGNLKFAKEVAEAGTWEKIVEAWKAWGLLSGPVTPTTNLFGTGAFMFMRPPVDALAAIIGMARGASPGMGESDRASMSEAVARLTGMLGGVQDALRSGKAALLTDEPSGKTETYRHANEGKFGEFVRWPYRVMSAGDAMTQTMYQRGELKTLAIRQAFDEGLSPTTSQFAERVNHLVDNPTPEMKVRADDAATRMAFNMPLGERGVYLQLFVNKWNLQWMMPFIRTPINITKELARMSPFAPMVGEWRADIAKGGVARDRAMAEMALGAGIMALTMAYTFSGDISGSGSPDPGKNRAKAGVWQPSSIKIGDTWYEYSRIQPTGTLMGLAADLAEAWDHMTDEERDKVPKMLARAFANAVTNQTFLQGITNFVNTLSDPGRYGGKFFQQFAGSVVPNIIGQPTVMADPVVRQVDGMLQAIQARIPGFRQQLIPKPDWLGEDVKTKERLGIIGPVRELPISNEKVRKEAADIGLSIADAPKKLHLGKGTGKLGDVELTQEERDRFARTAGRMANGILSKVVNQPGYDQLKPEMKRRIFQRALEAAHRVGAVDAFPPEKRQAYLEQITEKVQRELAPAQ